MKKSSYVDEKVFKTNEKITKLQNETKELFFKCLLRGEDENYFKKQLDKIWGKIDYTFMEDDIEEYVYLIHKYNYEMANVELTEEEIVNKKQNYALYLVALGLIMTQEDRYKRLINMQYERTKNSPGYEFNRTEYLKQSVPKFNSQTVPYHLKNGNIREVKLSSYVAMVENTNLTKSAWNTTLNDADLLGADKFYIPYHLFSCEHCREYQGRILSRDEVMAHIGIDEEQEGELLHPNCKCSLLIYWGGKIDNPYKYTEDELNEQYDIRQKINSLTLKKSELLTDRRIYNDMIKNGKIEAQEELDEVNKKIRGINSKIKDYQAQLPTEEMRKSVVAINR